MGEVVVLRKDGPGPWLVSYCDSSAGFVAVKSDANNVHSCRSSSIPSGYAACDCRSLPVGPPTLQHDAARSIDTIEQVREVTRDAVPIVQKGEYTPGTYRCRQPFTIGDLQFCNAVGVWQISSHYCGPYTCYDAPGDEGPRCQCRPEARSTLLLLRPQTGRSKQGKARLFLTRCPVGLQARLHVLCQT
jgi:hypothetical protein